MMDPLQELYPFLHGQAKNPQREKMALLESVRQKSAESRNVKAQFFAAHAEALVSMAAALAAVYQRGGMLYTMGNGGSSCDADHLAVEFMHPVTTGRPALAAHSLVSDRAMLTAVGNDVGYQHVFLRQLTALARSGDALFGFSTSGNSANLMAAYRKARETGMVTFGLAGMQGGEMQASGLVDHLLVVATDSIHRIQECHVTTFHILWDLVHTILADRRGDLRAEVTEDALRG